MRTPRAAGVLGAVVALLGSISACQGEAETKAPEEPAAEAVRPPELSPTWQLDGLENISAGARNGRVRAWVDDERVVLVGTKSLVALDPATGEQRWQAQARPAWGTICGISSEPSERFGAVLFERGDACTAVAALDLESGEFAWYQATDAVLTTVAAGTENVAATTACGAVRAWSLDGEELRPIVKGRPACLGSSAVAGDLAITKANGIAAAFNIDTRDRVWRTEVEAEGADLFSIASTSPLVTDESAEGQRTLVNRGEDGASAGRAGLIMGQGSVFEPIDRSGDVLLGAYGKYQWSALDLNSGETLWSRPVDAYTRAIGVQEDRVLLSRVVGVADHPAGEVWIGSRLLDGGTGVQLLGRLPLAEPGALVEPGAESEPLTDAILRAGNQVLALSAGRLSAYQLPTTGAEVDTFPRTAEAAAMPSGDLTSDDVAEICRAVSDRTLEALGFRDLSLPDPAACIWQERFAPADVNRSISTTLTALPPGTDESAWSAAARLEDERLDSRAADGADFKSITGVTDDAWLATESTADGSQTTATLIGRYRNVVIEVHGVQTAAQHGTNAELVAPDAWAAGVVAATNDLLTALGAPTSEMPTQAAGQYVEVGDVCKVAAPVAAEIAPSAKAEATTPRAADGRVSGCIWNRDLAVVPELLVTAYAVPGGLDGSGAEDRAAAHFALEGDDPAVPGLGDEAKIWGFRFSGDEAVGVKILTARRANLVVNVSLVMRGPDRVIGERAVQVARRVLDNI